VYLRSTWAGDVTGHATIRLAYAGNNDTELIALTPAGACRFSVRLGVTTPSAVIIAVLTAPAASRGTPR